MASHGHSASRKGGHEQKHRPVTRSNKIINPNRTIALKGGSSGKKKVTHLRDNATIKRIAMYKDKPIHNAKGEFLAGAYMSRTPDAVVKRIQPDRRWFGNTRVVDQTELANFREAMGAKVKDPYSVVMRSKKLPMGLLTDPFKVRQCTHTHTAGANMCYPLATLRSSLFLCVLRFLLLPLHCLALHCTALLCAPLMNSTRIDLIFMRAIF